jgi:hypothetical protein
MDRSEQSSNKNSKAAKANGSKADLVRAYLASHPKAKPKEIARALTTSERTVDAKYVRKVISRSGRGNGAPRRSRKATFGPRPFPAFSLEESLRVARVIKEYNGGNPWPPEEVAQAVGIGAKTNKFYAFTASARDYGLTEGTRNTSLVELTDLGRSVVYAASPEQEYESLKAAFFHVPAFRQVFEYYDDGMLPDPKYLRNTLESVFKISPEYHEEFREVYTANRRFILANAPDSMSNIRVAEATSTVSHSIVIAEPDTKSTRTAFVIMPFTEKSPEYPSGFYSEVLRNLITPAAVEAGFKVETAQREGSDIIQSTIVRDLLAADLVIADLSDHNPNVLFELGLRMAFEKPTALIRARGTKPIFDVDNMLRVYDYSPNLWRSTLEQDVPKLTAHIRGTWEKRDTAVTYMQLLKGAATA